MLTFSTVFPLSVDCSSEDVQRLMKQWIAGGPHSMFGEELKIAGHGERQWQESLDGERIQGLATTDNGSEYAAIRYEKTEDDGVTWTTEVAFEGTDQAKRVSVRVQCESQITSLTLPPARKPYIVRQLVTQFGGGFDGDLQVSDSPIELKNGEIDYAARMINSNCANQLPIVYLSAPSNGQFLISPERLAHWLSGIAHVVVEPNREFSFRLMHEVNHENAYGGAIGIYWPDRSQKVVLLGRDFDFDSKALAAEVSKLTRNRAIRLRIPRTLTWDYQRELLARQEIDRLKREGSSDIEEYIRNFDEELKAKDLAIEGAEAEIRRLEAEVFNLRAQAKKLEGEPIFCRGSENDLYQNEALEILRDAILNAISHSKPESRRRHVLESLCVANESTENGAELRQRVKEILSNYRKLEGSIEHDLEELGFEIISEGKHHKLTFKGDARYLISMPKTSSDHRAGKNLVSQINSVLF